MADRLQRLRRGRNYFKDANTSRRDNSLIRAYEKLRFEETKALLSNIGREEMRDDSEYSQANMPRQPSERKTFDEHEGKKGDIPIKTIECFSDEKKSMLRIITNEEIGNNDYRDDFVQDRSCASSIVSDRGNFQSSAGTTSDLMAQTSSQTIALQDPRTQHLPGNVETTSKHKNGTGLLVATSLPQTINSPATPAAPSSASNVPYLARRSPQLRPRPQRLQNSDNQCDPLAVLATPSMTRRPQSARESAHTPGASKNPFNVDNIYVPHDQHRRELPSPSVSRHQDTKGSIGKGSIGSSAFERRDMASTPSSLQADKNGLFSHQAEETGNMISTPSGSLQQQHTDSFESMNAYRSTSHLRLPSLDSKYKSPTYESPRSGILSEKNRMRQENGDESRGGAREKDNSRLPFEGTGREKKSKRSSSVPPRPETPSDEFKVPSIDTQDDQSIPSSGFFSCDEFRLPLQDEKRSSSVPKRRNSEDAVQMSNPYSQGVPSPSLSQYSKKSLPYLSNNSSVEEARVAERLRRLEGFRSTIEAPKIPIETRSICTRESDNESHNDQHSVALSTRSEQSKRTLLERKLNAKTNHMNLLQTELTELKSSTSDKLSSAKAEIEKLKRERDDLANKLSLHEDALDDARARLAETKAAYNAIQVGMADIQNRIKSADAKALQVAGLKVRLEDSESFIQMLEKDKELAKERNQTTTERLRRDLEAKEHENKELAKSLTRQIESLEDERDEIMKELGMKDQEHEEAVSLLENKLSAAERLTSSFREEILELKAVIDEKEKMGEERKEKLTEAQRELERCKRKCSDAEGLLAEKVDEFERIKKDMERDFDSRVQDNSETVTSLEKALSRKEKFVESLQTELKEMTQAMEEREDNNDKALVESLQAELSIQMEEKALLNERLFSLEQENVDIHKKVEEIMREHSEGTHSLEKDLFDKDELILYLKDEIKKLETEAKERQQAIQDQQDFNDLADKYEEALQQNDLLHETVDELRSTIDVLKQQHSLGCEADRQEKNKLQDQLASTLAELEASQNELQNVKVESEQSVMSLVRQMAEKEQERELLEKGSADMVVAMSELKKELCEVSERASRVSTLHARLSETENENIDLSKENESLNDEVERLKNSLSIAGKQISQAMVSKEKLSTLEKENEKIKNENSELRLSLSDEKRKSEGIQRKADEELKRESELLELERDNDQIVQDNHHLMEEVEKLRNQVEAAERKAALSGCLEVKIMELKDEKNILESAHEVALRAMEEELANAMRSKTEMEERLKENTRLLAKAESIMAQTNAQTLNTVMAALSKKGSNFAKQLGIATNEENYNTNG